MDNILTKPILNSNPRMLILLILLIALVGFISMDIYFPSLPAISSFLKVGDGVTQLSLTIFLFGFGFSQIIYGPLSDYFGRRPVLLLGFSIYLIGSLVLFNAENFTLLLVGRLIQGIGAGAGASLCRVLLRDIYIGNEMAKVTSFLTIGIALATSLAPALGGVIQDSFGFYGNFFVMFLFGAVVSILVLLYLPETSVKESGYSLHPIEILKSYINLFKNKMFMGNVLCAGFSLSSLLAYAIINPFLLQNNLGLSAALYGIVTLLIASGELLGTFINGRFVGERGYKFMMYVGIALMIIASIILFIFNICNIFTVVSISLPTFIITVSSGIIIPNASAGAFSEISKSIGTAGAIYGFTQIIITVVTTYFISKIVHQTPQTLGLVFMSLAILCSTVYYYINSK